MLPEDVDTYVHRIGRVGRAERIGLALSIVGTAAEKVWWCQKKNKPPCSDTRLFEEGGNCKWYQESALLQSIERLLVKNKTGITRLNVDLNVPADMEGLIKGKAYGDYAGAGSSTLDPRLSAHLDKLSTIVKELSVAEFALQGNYFSGVWRS
jgi:superfamily II DNA/RNA helicase